MASSFSRQRKPYLNMERALLDWPFVLQYDVKAKYRFISRKVLGYEVFSAERSLSQSKATRVCIRSINQSIRSISVRLLFLFCSRVFISRSYENRSGSWIPNPFPRSPRKMNLASCRFEFESWNLNTLTNLIIILVILKSSIVTKHHSIRYH